MESFTLELNFNEIKKVSTHLNSLKYVHCNGLTTAFYILIKWFSEKNMIILSEVAKIGKNFNIIGLDSPSLNRKCSLLPMNYKKWINLQCISKMCCWIKYS